MREINLCLQGLFLAAILLSTKLATAQTSYYDILKAEFTSARDTISAAHIDIAGDPTAKICVRINKDQPDNVRLVHLNKITIWKDPRGPGLPSKKFVKVALNEGSAPDARRYAKATETTYSSREITSVQKLGGEMTLRVRRKGEFLHFETVQNEQAAQYGYCYEANSSGALINFVN